jgi:protease-4
MKRVLIFFMVWIFGSGPDIAADPVDGLEFQSESVATSQFVTAGVVNPAGLAFLSATGVRYTHSFTDSTYGGDDGLLISSRRGFFGIEWLEHSSNIFRRKFTLAIGDRIAPNFYMGISYSWFGGSEEAYRKMKNYKIGMIYQPRSFVSLGLVADRLNQPGFGTLKLKRLYRPGMAIRPLGEKITLSSDLRWLEGDGIDRLEGNFRVALGPFRGGRFSADYRTEGSWRVGVTFDFEQTRVGAQGRFHNSGDYEGGSYFVEVGAVRYNSVYNRPGRIGTLTLSDDIEENPHKSFFLGSAKRSFLEVISSLRKGAADDRISGLLLKIDGFRMSFATAQEIRDAIKAFRSNGKKVTVYLDNGGDLAYYVASAADDVIMKPGGYLMLNGLSATATFYKGTMDKIGIRAQMIRTGPHKTTGNAVTEEGLTAEAEEQINWLLDDLHDQVVEAISVGRRILPDDVRRLIDEGPYTARDAFVAGLLDDLKYYDEITEDSEGPGQSSFLDLTEFYSRRDYYPRWSEPKKVAVVYAEGSIVAGSSGNDLIQGKTLGGRTLARSLSSVRKDGGIRAVVLRVNSPGGEIFGSDRIYRELELLKGKKPLVISMGGVAASGGYYISCPGDEVLASPGTITGSIGVIVGKADLSGFYEKIGLRKETLKRGDRADITSTNRLATEDEIEHVEKQIWQFYGDFVSKVSEWRKIDYDSVDAVGQGRVWTGRQALKRGLVDSYGGLWEAIEKARQKAEIDSEDELILESYPRRGLFSIDWPGFPGLRSSVKSIVDADPGGIWQMRMPFDLEIE